MKFSFLLLSVIAIPAVYGSSESGNKWYPGKYLKKLWPVAGVGAMLAAASMNGGVASTSRDLVHQDFYQPTYAGYHHSGLDDFGHKRLSAVPNYADGLQLPKYFGELELPKYIDESNYTDDLELPSYTSLERPKYTWGSEYIGDYQGSNVSHKDLETNDDGSEIWTDFSIFGQNVAEAMSNLQAFSLSAVERMGTYAAVNSEKITAQFNHAVQAISTSAVDADVVVRKTLEDANKLIAQFRDFGDATFAKFAVESRAAAHAVMEYATEHVTSATRASGGYAARASVKYDETRDRVIARARVNADDAVLTSVEFANKVYQTASESAKTIREMATAKAIRALEANREFDEMIVTKVSEIRDYAKVKAREAAEASREFATALAVKADATGKKMHAHITAKADELNDYFTTKIGKIEAVATAVSTKTLIALNELRDYALAKAYAALDASSRYATDVSANVAVASSDFAAAAKSKAAETVRNIEDYALVKSVEANDARREFVVWAEESARAAAARLPSQLTELRRSTARGVDTVSTNLASYLEETARSIEESQIRISIAYNHYKRDLRATIDNGINMLSIAINTRAKAMDVLHAGTRVLSAASIMTLNAYIPVIKKFQEAAAVTLSDETAEYIQESAHATIAQIRTLARRIIAF